jgi:hypothetical protein
MIAIKARVANKVDIEVEEAGVHVACIVTTVVISISEDRVEGLDDVLNVTVDNKERLDVLDCKLI